MLRCAITERTRLPGDEQERQSALVRQAASWAADGVDFVQLREKDMEAGALVELARAMLAAFSRYGAAPRLLINGRADVAIATGADGVHLTAPAGELMPGQVRQVYAAAGLGEPVVSVSCHTVAEVLAARKAGANLILFGPVFEKRVAGELVCDGLGLELLQTACHAAATVPVLALGGVTAENSADCVAAGAAGVAGIRLFAGTFVATVP
jgi:thiamine-phosphate pyrophosphorylase